MVDEDLEDEEVWFKVEQHQVEEVGVSDAGTDVQTLPLHSPS